MNKPLSEKVERIGINELDREVLMTDDWFWAEDVKEAVQELKLLIFRSDYDESRNVWYQRGWDDNAKRFHNIIEKIFGEELCNSPRSSMIEHRTSNPKVEGANPFGDTSLSEEQISPKGTERSAPSDTNTRDLKLREPEEQIIKGVVSNETATSAPSGLKGCDEFIPMFYGNAEYRVACGKINPIGKKIIYCKKCKAKLEEK